MIPDIITYLKTVTEVTDIVGSDPCKVFGGDVPDYVLTSKNAEVSIKPPYILLETAGGPTIKHMGGDSGVRERNFQVTCADVRSSQDAELLYDAVRTALGFAAYEQWGNTFVQYSEMDEPTDVSAAPTDGGPVSLFLQAGRLTVRYNVG